jgi:DNA-binding MarR family transcriptional regulator
MHLKPRWINVPFWLTQLGYTMKESPTRFFKHLPGLANPIKIDLITGLYLPTTTLASRLVSRSPDMTRMLDKLEAKGLISRRRRVENRRIVEVTLTQLGAKLIAQIASDVRLCSREQLGHLGTQKLRQLIALLVEARRTHEDDSATDAWASYRSQ